MNRSDSLYDGHLMKVTGRILAAFLILVSNPAFSEGTVENFAIHDEPQLLPNLELAAGDGSLLSLESFRGRVVLLNVWATWCGPCRKEMPTLDRLQAQLGGPDFEVVALSIDKAGVEVVRDFYEEIGIRDLRIYMDSTKKATRTLKVVGLPTTLLIDRQGREVARLIGPAEWDTPEMSAFFRQYINGKDQSQAPSSVQNASIGAIQNKARNLPNQTPLTPFYEGY